MRDNDSMTRDGETMIVSRGIELANANAMELNAGKDECELRLRDGITKAETMNIGRECNAKATSGHTKLKL